MGSGWGYGFNPPDYGSMTPTTLPDGSTISLFYTNTPDGTSFFNANIFTTYRVTRLDTNFSMDLGFSMSGISGLFFTSADVGKTIPLEIKAIT